MVSFFIFVDAPRYKKLIKHAESISTYKDGVLSITKRDAVFKTVIGIKPYYSSKVAYKPEQYVYTGATVGGITTGGVHKEGGYNYISSTHKTAKCELHYHGDKQKVIDKIQLTPALAEEARKCAQIKGFLNEKDQIALESNIPMSRMDSELFLYFGKSQSAEMYNITSKYAEMRAPSREKCEIIIEWLCGGEASKE